jgi:hypothetical protein
MLADIERLQAVGERVFVAGKQSPRPRAVARGVSLDDLVASARISVGKLIPVANSKSRS